MLSLRNITGAPLLWVALLSLLALSTSLRADGPTVETVDWLARARTSLSAGETESLTLAVRALKAKPSGADENVQAGLTLFWMGQFSDAARHIRRALSIDASALGGIESLGTRMPSADARTRLRQLGLQSAENADLCFLAGALLLADNDRPRALAFLIRAEELAGTDAQAARLVGGDDRNRARAATAMRKGDWQDATIAFAFACMDTPAAAEHYAGLALALAAEGELALAHAMLEVVQARYQRDRFFAWAHELEPAPGALARVARTLLDAPEATAADARLAGLIALSCRKYMTTREAGLHVLTLQRLDRFAGDLLEYVDKNDLHGDPESIEPQQPPADPPPQRLPEPQVPPPTIDDARRHVRAGEFTLAMKALDPQVEEGAPGEVFYLLFVANVGRNELQDAGTALQTWFMGATREERARLNAIQTLFAEPSQFEAWHKHVLDARNADPNRGLPRLLNSYIEVTRGRYRAARDELVVPRVEAPGNPMVTALDALLQEPEFRDDAAQGSDTPSAKALHTLALQQFQDGKYEDARRSLLRAIETDPKLPLAHEALFVCSFALGDFEEAVQRLQHLFEFHEVATADLERFRVLVVPGYGDSDAFKNHMAALRAHCEARPLAHEPLLLLGVLELDRRRFNEAAQAFQKWHDLAPGQRDPAALRLREYVRTRAE